MHLRRTFAVSLTVLSCVLGMAGCDRGQQPGNIGKVAPEFAISDGSQSLDLHQLRGKVVVLNLWATWCAPCVEELPSLLDLSQRMPQLAVVAVSTDQDPQVYQRFLVQHHVSVTNVRDADQRINALYGTVQIPETYIIDKHGVIRRKFIGAQAWTGPEISSYLSQLEREN